MSASAQAPTVQRRAATRNVAPFIPWAVLAVLIVAMLLNTKFLTASEAEALVPKPFNAKTFVSENFEKTAGTLEEKATDMATLAPAVVANKAEACTQYGVDLGGGSCAYAVKATGTVASADANWVTVNVTGLPAGTTVRVPLGVALNGTPVRDAAGYKFSDFPGQTQYQQVSNEFKAAMQAEVLSKLNASSLTGKQISIVGAYAQPGPSTTFIIQPMKITEG